VFIQTIDGLGQESLCFGEGGYGVERSEKSRAQITEQLRLAESFGLSILSIDYCKSNAKTEFSKAYNEEYGFIGFAAENFELTEIPEFKAEIGEPYDVRSLSDAKKFVVILNPEAFSHTDDLVSKLAATDYDVIIMDPDFNNKAGFTAGQIETLKTKAGGGSRLVVAYLSIGEAEDYRHYWQSDWFKNPPDWMGQENTRWDGNYVVQYWRDEWQDIVLYAEGSMLNRILDLNFDGAYLDLVDAYETFED
jgi:cysteinyl-tRNA synthetase